MPAPIRTRLYREFLTPTLHRRFTQAAEVSLLLSYLTAIIIGEQSSSKENRGWMSLSEPSLITCSILVMVPTWFSRHPHPPALPLAASCLRAPSRPITFRDSINSLPLSHLQRVLLP